MAGWLDYLTDPLGAGVNALARATTGDLLFPMERHQRSQRERVLGPPREMQRAPGPLGSLGEETPPVTLASMGQRYKDMPPATFDERFGAPTTPEQERALTKQLFLQEHQKYLEEQRQLQRTPEYTWPAGFIRL